MELINEYKRNKHAKAIQNSTDLEEKLISEGKIELTL